MTAQKAEEHADLSEAVQSMAADPVGHDVGSRNGNENQKMNKMLTGTKSRAERGTGTKNQNETRMEPEWKQKGTRREAEWN